MNPLLSIIIPVYNVEKYLAETLDSVIAQDIGFKDNIEIVLVNDGSTDNSEAICKEYKNKYPNNIIYVKQKNAGVSSARNKGIGLAKGRYLNFLDADDLWSSDAFSLMIDFIEEHKDEVDFVASKIKFFDRQNGEHVNNYKFKKSRVINLDIEPENPITHNPTCVYKREVFSKIKFDTNLKISEDAKLLSEVLLEKRAYGVVKGPAYYYRKRQDDSSAIGGSLNSKSFYLDTPTNAYLPMMQMWSDESGRPHEFMQHTMLNDLRWRIPSGQIEVLSVAEQSDYKKAVHEIIGKIDEAVIRRSRFLDLEQKDYMLRIKGLAGVGYSKRLPKVYMDFIHPKDEGFLIEGYLDLGIDSHVKDVRALTSLGEFKLKKEKRHQRSKYFAGSSMSGGAVFSVFVKSKKKDKLTFVLSESGDRKKLLKLRPKQFTGLSELSSSFTVKDEAILRRFGRRIYVRSNSPYRTVAYEALYLLRLIFHWNVKAVVRYTIDIPLRRDEIMSGSSTTRLKIISKPILALLEAVATIPRAIILRLTYRIELAFKRRPIWIISDRSNGGQDNGEAFYSYLLDRGFDGADVYFLLDKTSADYRRIQRMGGKVLPQGTWRHYLKFLMSDKIISAHADIEVTNPFWRQVNHFIDLFSFDFIFLQHGVIYNDLSDWLNRFEKNIKLFVTSANPEYESILGYPYYYNKENVLLSGLARHDLLGHTPLRKLVITPTNRKPLLLPTNKLGQRSYNPAFKDSEYYKFFNKLINDPKLIAVMKKYSMTGDMLVHPAHSTQVKDFVGNDTISIAEFPYNYRKMLSEGSIMLTDYSSVSFDFSYLRKPVVYTNFDKTEFYEGQVYSSSDFFTFEENGFGPVSYDYKTTLHQLIKIIENKCKLEQKYINRAEEFFLPTDGNNRKRIFDAIIELDKRKSYDQGRNNNQN